MKESQSPTALDSNTSDTIDGQKKINLWLIIAIVSGAIALICVLFLKPVLLGSTPHYSPANFEDEFEKNHAKWDEAHISHYEMVVDFSGYGAYDQMPWTLEIQNEKVLSVINAQRNSVPDNNSADWFTVTALFVEIEDRYQRKAPSIKVTYNPGYGYPEDISINPYTEPCCQDYDIKIRDFQILP